MKKIYKANLEFECRYVKSIIFTWGKKPVVEKVKFSITDEVVLAETDDEAITKFKERNEYWKEERYLPAWAWKNYGQRVDYKILNKSIKVTPVDCLNIENLKQKMQANEFLAYCRQELIESVEVVK